MKPTVKALIIEDETGAASNLKALLKEVEPVIEVMAVIDTVVETIEWFASKSTPDIVFMDIHLADGDAFDIFGKVDINCPIIFTTAYDRYALEAFKVNSVDYILKPIKAEDLRRALDKIRRLSRSERDEYIGRMHKIALPPASKAFIIHVRDKLVPVDYEKIAYFYTTSEKVIVYCTDGRCFPMDKSLDAIISILPKHSFFRANRQFIVSREMIQDMLIWYGNRLCINLKIEATERIIVSKARVREFKNWFTSA